MELLYIILAVVSIVTIICFFVMTSDIRKIKKAIVKKPDAVFDEYERHKLFGDKEKAIEVLKVFIYEKCKYYADILNTGGVNESLIFERLEKLKEKYEDEFKAKNVPFPTKEDVINLSKKI